MSRKQGFYWRHVTAIELILTEAEYFDTGDDLVVNTFNVLY
jgi:hypothetical protein